jgi:WD40 repeat protein
LELLPQLQMLTSSDLLRARVMVHEQQYFEFLEKGQIHDALSVLRQQLSPIHPDINRLHMLSSCILFKTLEDLRKHAEWLGSQGGSRSDLLKKLQELIPSSLLVPSQRLLTLIDQAVDYQVARCSFHNCSTHTYSLLQNHSCLRGVIPKRLLHTLSNHTDEVWFAKFSHNGQRLASASKDKSVIIWDFSNPLQDISVLFELVGHSDPVSYLCWSPDDSLLCSVGNGPEVKIWDTHTGKCEHEWTVDDVDSMYACHFTRDGQHLVTSSTDQALSLWSLDGSEIRSWNGEYLNEIQVGKNKLGHDAVIGITETALRTYDLETGLVDSIALASPPVALSLSSDSRLALLTSTDPSELHLWDLHNKVIVRRFDGLKQSRYVLRNAFGGVADSFVMVGSEDCRIFVFHRTGSEEAIVLSGHSGTVNCLTWSPTDPHILVSASDDRTIKVWGLDDEQQDSVHRKTQRDMLMYSKPDQPNGSAHSSSSHSRVKDPSKSE